jgi:hypothetical protein
LILTKPANQLDGVVFDFGEERISEVHKLRNKLLAVRRWVVGHLCPQVLKESRIRQVGGNWHFMRARGVF